MKRPKGPELKMPEMKVPPFLTDLYYDFRERRLLPLIGLVVVAIVAVPFLLGNGSEEVAEEPETSAVDVLSKRRRTHRLSPSSSRNPGCATTASGSSTVRDQPVQAALHEVADGWRREPAGTDGRKLEWRLGRWFGRNDLDRHGDRRRGRLLPCTRTGPLTGRLRRQPAAERQRCGQHHQPALGRPLHVRHRRSHRPQQRQRSGRHEEDRRSGGPQQGPAAGPAARRRRPASSPISGSARRPTIRCS